MKQYNILTIGMGAIGSLYTSRLQSKSTQVHCLTRTETDVIKKNGIRIKNPDNSITTFNPDFCYETLDTLDVVFDYVIIATKVLPEIHLIDTLKKVVSKTTSIVLIQNGIDIESTYVKAFKNNEIISGLAFVCVSKVSVGNIYHQDYGRLVIGAFQKGRSKKVEELKELFNQKVKCCSTSEFIVQDRFKKLLWNASFNPLSVIYKGATTKELLNIENMETTIKNIMKEVQRVAFAYNCTISSDDIQKNISDTYKMKPYKTSMCLDWERNKPLESDAILGNLLRLAEAKNISLPIIDRLYIQLKELSK